MPRSKNMPKTWPGGIRKKWGGDFRLFVEKHVIPGSIPRKRMPFLHRTEVFVRGNMWLFMMLSMMMLPGTLAHLTIGLQPGEGIDAEGKPSFSTRDYGKVGGWVHLFSRLCSKAAKQDRCFVSKTIPPVRIPTTTLIPWSSNDKLILPSTHPEPKSTNTTFPKRSYSPVYYTVWFFLCHRTEYSVHAAEAARRNLYIHSCIHA